MKNHDEDVLARIEEQLELLNKKIDDLLHSSPRPAERKFSSSRSFGDRDKPSFKTVCAQCGKSCDVPFKPVGNRPVFCSECFAQQQGDDDRKPKFHKKSGGRDFRKPFSPKKPFFKK